MMCAVAVGGRWSLAQTSSGAAETSGTDRRRAQALSGAPVWNTDKQVFVCAHGCVGGVCAHTWEKEKERERKPSIRCLTAAGRSGQVWDFAIAFDLFFSSSSLTTQTKLNGFHHHFSFYRSTMQVWRIWM